MLNEVDQAMKKSKLFTMTQLNSATAEIKQSVKFDDRRTRDRNVIENTIDTMMGSAKDSSSGTRTKVNNLAKSLSKASL